MSKTSELKASPLFSELEPAELETILSVGRERTFPAGQVICPEGAPSSSLFVIRAGTVRVSHRLSRTDVPLSEMGPGEIFGEMSLIEGGVSSATLTALDPTTVLQITKEDLDRILAGNLSLAVRFWRGIARELRARLIRTSDAVATHADISRALVENPNFREFYALCCR